MSLDGFGKWLLSTAQDGQIGVPCKDGDFTVKLSVAVDLGATIPFDDLRASAKLYLDQYEQRSVDHKLGKLPQDVGAQKLRVPKKPTATVRGVITSRRSPSFVITSRVSWRGGRGRCGRRKRVRSQARVLDFDTAAASQTDA